MTFHVKKAKHTKTLCFQKPQHVLLCSHFVYKVLGLRLTRICFQKQYSKVRKLTQSVAVDALTLVQPLFENPVDNLSNCDLH